MRRSRLAAAAVVFACLASAGCMHPVKMRVTECRFVSSYPLQEPVYDYFARQRSGFPYEVTGEEMLEIHLATRVNLRALAERTGSYSVWWKAFECPRSAPNELWFDGGTVFQGGEAAGTTEGATPEEYSYKLFLPIDVAKTIERSGTLHFEEERVHVTEQIRVKGLCLRVGGGSMWGTGLKSNVIRLPVVISEPPLRIVGIEPGFEPAAASRATE